MSGYEKITHFAQFIDFELVELFIALYFTSIAASVPEICLPKI